MTQIFLSAGETSGDRYGAEIIGALKQLLPAARFSGLGGLEMERAGLERVVRAEDVAVMGITEILRHVPKIYASYRRLVRSIRQQRPAAAVLIDFPDVNFRLAKRLRRLGIPVIWFVSPQLWAWKRRRLRWVQERVDRMLVIFPFEERFYRARGVAAEFVGHPLASEERTSVTREEFARAHGLDPGKEWVALLPGSRMREIEANLPEMVRAAEILSRERGGSLEFLLPVASGVRPEAVLMQWEAAGGVFTPIHLVDDARTALEQARASVVASGTATVLAAIAGNPFVVVYRVSRLTFAVAKRLVRYPPEIPAVPDATGTLPVAMVNLLAGRRIVPELLNEQFTGKAVAEAVLRLLGAGPEREEQVRELALVREALRGVPDGQMTGAARVAAAVLEVLGGEKSREVRSGS